MTAAATRRRRGLANSPVERLQPQGIWSILDRGFDVMRFRFPTIVALSAIVVLPLVGIPAALSALDLGSSLDRSRTVGDFLGAASNGQTLDAFLSLVGGALALALVGVGMAHLICGWLVGTDHSLADTLRHVGRRSWVIVVAWLVVFPLKSIALAACLVGVFFALGAFLALSPVVSAEKLGPFASIGRCWRLSRPRLGAMTALVMISLVISLVLQGAVGIVVSIIRRDLLADSSWSWAVSGALTVAFRLVLTPIQAAWATLAYLDLRVRAEGLDLELEMAELFGGVG